MKLSGKIRLLGFLLLFLTVSGAVGAEEAETADRYLNEGIKAYREGAFSEAAESFRQALERDPEHQGIHYNLAITLWQQKQFQDVLAHLNRVIEIDPDTDLAIKARQNLADLEESGIFQLQPREEIVEEEAVATLQELIADLEFGTTRRRVEAALELARFEEEEDAVRILEATALNERELPEIRTAAVISLSTIADPISLPVFEEILQDRFATETKASVVEGLSRIRDPESLRIILNAWATQWPGGIEERVIVQLTRELGREEFAGIIRSAYQQSRDMRRVYLAMALGLMGDPEGVPTLVGRLRADYPPVDPGPAPGRPRAPRDREMDDRPPDMMEMPEEDYRPIIRERDAAHTLDDEIALRAEIVEILGVVAGEKQIRFLDYLGKNDNYEPVRKAATEAIPVLQQRVTRAQELYEAGSRLAGENRLGEAIPLMRDALRHNPDAPYAEEIRQLRARNKYEQALALLEQEGQEPEAVTLLRNALLLDPEAPFREAAEAQLIRLRDTVMDREMEEQLRREEEIMRREEEQRRRR